MNNGHITAKQDRFCREYAIDCNATQAAIRAGYSKRTANEQGSRLLANVSIQGRISELDKAICDRLDLDAQYVIERLRRNEGEAYEQGKITESTRALELLGKHLGLFKEKVEMSSQVQLGPRRIIMNCPNKEAADEEASKALVQTHSGKEAKP